MIQSEIMNEPVAILNILGPPNSPPMHGMKRRAMSSRRHGIPMPDRRTKDNRLLIKLGVNLKSKFLFYAFV